MARKSKEELLAASMQALSASQISLSIAKLWHNQAVRIDTEIQKEYEKRQSDYITIIHELKIDRDWLLQRADDHRRDAKRYLRLSKRLSRRARWRL